MQFDRKVFFDKVRLTPFPGALSATQVAGCEAIVAEFELRGLTDVRWLAYMLATAFHETAKTMQPIAEYGHGKGHAYGKPVNGLVYYGRGYVQLTWSYNYRTLGDLLHVDLIGKPELALNPDIAAKIMFEGMIRGLFTGKKLADYLHAGVTDFVGARKIINGTDRAETIASYARQFHGALIAATVEAGAGKVPPPPDIAPVPVPKPKPPAAPLTAKQTGVMALLVLIFGTIATFVQAHPFIIGGSVFVIVLAFIATRVMRKPQA